MLFSRAALALLLASLFLPVRGSAADVLWVDPAAQLDSGDGSKERPFSSVDEGLRSGLIESGDELKLVGGDYGEILISGVRFDDGLTISAAEGETAHADAVRVEESANVTISGLKVWPSKPIAASELVGTDAESEHITFRSFEISSREDVSDYPEWTKQDWLDLRYSGVYLRGPNNTLADSVISGVSFGVATTGKNATVENSTISGFSGDAIRGLGDDSVYRGNRILDCIQIDDNHADAFQSWSVGPDRKPGTGVVRGLVLDGNYINEWQSEPVSPYRCSLQGIGLFDGPYERTIVQNNIIVVSAYHGIMILGAVDSRLINNTVVNSRGFGKTEPWVGVGDHKNGVIKAERNIIANNIAHDIRGASRVAFDGTLQINLALADPSVALVDPGKGDFTPIAGGRADGRGIASVAPALDFRGRARGPEPDIGAVEGGE